MKTMQKLFSPAQADEVLGGPAPPPPVGQALCRESLRWISLLKAIAGILTITKPGPFLRAFLDRNLVEIGDTVNVGAVLSLCDDGYYAIRIPLPSQVIKSAGRSYFFVGDVPEVVRSGVSLSGLVAKFDHAKDFYSPEERERFGIRDRLAVEFSRDYFAKLNEFLSPPPQEEEEALFKRYDNVVFHVSEVGKYRSVSLKNAIDEQFAKWRKERENDKDPLTVYSIKSIDSVLGAGGKLEDPVLLLVNSFWDRITEIVPDESKQTVKVLRMQISKLLEKGE